MGYHILDYDIELEIKKFQKIHQINILKVEMQDKNNYGKKGLIKKIIVFTIGIIIGMLIHSFLIGKI